jgi:hypothetical protein
VVIAMAAHARVCEHCKEEYIAQRASSRFCSDRCRSAARRSRPAAKPEPAPEVEPVVELVPAQLQVLRVTRRSIKAAEHLGKVDRGAARVLLRLAAQIDQAPILDKDSAITYLKYADALGLVPASKVRQRSAAPGKPRKSSLTHLRSVASGAG